MGYLLFNWIFFLPNFDIFVMWVQVGVCGFSSGGGYVGSGGGGGYVGSGGFGGMWVQVGGGGHVGMWVHVGSGGGGGGVEVMGSVGGGEQRSKRLGGGRAQRNLFAIWVEVLKWIRPGRTFALQSFRITQLINAEIHAKFCTTRKTKTKWKKVHFIVIFYLL